MKSKTLEKRLLKCMRENDLKTLKRVLDANPQCINAIFFNENGESRNPLSLLCRYYHLKEGKELLNIIEYMIVYLKADMFFENGDSSFLCPFYVAFYLNNNDLCKLFLKHVRSNNNRKCYFYKYEHWTPFHFCLYYGNNKLFNTLLVYYFYLNLAISANRKEKLLGLKKEELIEQEINKLILRMCNRTIEMKTFFLDAILNRPKENVDWVFTDIHFKGSTYVYSSITSIPFRNENWENEQEMVLTKFIRLFRYIDIFEEIDMVYVKREGNDWVLEKVVGITTPQLALIKGKMDIALKIRKMKKNSLKEDCRVYFKPVHNYIPLAYKRWIGMTFKEMLNKIKKKG